MKNEMVRHIINCDADPFIPSGWSVKSHTKGGQLAFDPAKVKFYLSSNQQDKKAIKGKQLRKELANESVLNANVLDYLLAHQELIPENWKEDEQGNIRFIFFWGTIYRGLSGDLDVRYLYWYGERWSWFYDWLDCFWYSNYPAAVSAGMMKHIINCDADPFIPSGWKVESHTKGGQLAFDPAKVKLYLSRNQQNGKSIEGNKLRKELANKPVLNANVLDYLIENSHIIPEDWKEDERGNIRYVFFWGTIFRDSVGYLYVRCLCFDNGWWLWSCHWLDYGWFDFDPAALRAS